MRARLQAVNRELAALDRSIDELGEGSVVGLEDRADLKLTEGDVGAEVRDVEGVLWGAGDSGDERLESPRAQPPIIAPRLKVDDEASRTPDSDRWATLVAMLRSTQNKATSRQQPRAHDTGHLDRHIVRPATGAIPALDGCVARTHGRHPCLHQQTRHASRSTQQYIAAQRGANSLDRLADSPPSGEVLVPARM